MGDRVGLILRSREATGRTLGDLAGTINQVSGVIGGINSLEAQRLHLADVGRSKAIDMEAIEPGSGAKEWRQKYGPWFGEAAVNETTDAIEREGKIKRLSLETSLLNVDENRRQHARSHAASLATKIETGEMTLDEARQELDSRLAGFDERIRGDAASELVGFAQKKRRQVESEFMTKANDVVSDLERGKSDLERKLRPKEAVLLQFQIDPESPLEPQIKGMSEEQREGMRFLHSQYRDVRDRIDRINGVETRVQAMQRQGKFDELGRFLVDNASTIARYSVGLVESPTRKIEEPKAAKALPPSEPGFIGIVDNLKKAGKTLSEALVFVREAYAGEELKQAEKIVNERYATQSRPGFTMGPFEPIDLTPPKGPPVQ